MHFQGRAESGAGYASQYDLRIAYPSDNSEDVDTVLQKLRKLRACSTKIHGQVYGWPSRVEYVAPLERSGSISEN